MEAPEEQKAAKPKESESGANIDKMSIKGFFEILAEEWGKPLTKLEKQIKSLEDEDIITVKDLDHLVADEISWKEVTADWTVGLRNRVKIKLSDLKAAAGKAGNVVKQAYPFTHKECWIFHESDYKIVSTLPGLEKLGDLPNTKNDAVNAKRMALRMGILEANIKDFTGMSINAIKNVFRDGLADFILKNKDGKRSFLLVYVAGHGVCDQMQNFVLNDPEHNLCNIEEKLRSLSKESDTNVLAFYDVCR